MFSNIQVVIEAEVGSGATGDVSIDDITMYDGNCELCKYRPDQSSMLWLLKYVTVFVMMLCGADQDIFRLLFVGIDIKGYDSNNLT